ncbi:MAG: SDR family oxidoreductase [Gemmatimonadetes bacterium]|nr:SDR family oxidoreductase [Gemmatimonadota bacterium]
MLDLSGRAVLVTGGSRGIGAATARLFARAGAKVALTYQTRAADAEQVAREVNGVALQADLRTPAGNEAAVQRTLDAFGRLDAFIANAGIWPPTGVAVRDMTDEQWHDTVASNLDSVFFGSRAAVRAMGPGSAVVIVSSTAGQRGEAMHADYASSKGAVIAFVKSLAVEAAPDITVNCVAPGWVDTEMAAPALRGADRAMVEAGIPLRRIASAEDIAGPILFLCTPLARHITGEILNVNGGSVLCG